MTTPRTLDPFQQALLDELRLVVADHPAGRSPQWSRPRWRRPALVAALVGLVAGGFVVAPAVVGREGGPAYAVVAGANGLVDVSVMRLEDADGLEQALHDAGVRADVTYLPRDTACAEGRYRVAVPPDGAARVVYGIGSGGIRVELAPGAVAHDQTLVISASRTSDSVGPDGTRSTAGVTGSVGVAEGAVGPCRPVTRTP